jgi:hypothetical protein
VTVNVIYFGLLFTTALHGFAVKVLGPAIKLVLDHIDPNCYTWRYCSLEQYAVNIVLYTFWIFIVLLGIDVLRHLCRKTITAN